MAQIRSMIVAFAMGMPIIITPPVLKTVPGLGGATLIPMVAEFATITQPTIMLPVQMIAQGF